MKTRQMQNMLECCLITNEKDTKTVYRASVTCMCLFIRVLITCNKCRVVFAPFPLLPNLYSREAILLPFFTFILFPSNFSGKLSPFVYIHKYIHTYIRTYIYLICWDQINLAIKISHDHTVDWCITCIVTAVAI